MINSIKADLYHIMHSKTFRLVVVMVFLMQLRAVFTMAPVDLFNDSYFDPHMTGAVSSIYMNDIRVMAYNYGILIEIVFTTGILITSMYSEGLLKNSIVCGMSLAKFPIMKTVAALYINLFLLFLHNMLIFLLNYFINGQGESSYFPRVLAITFWQAFPVICWTCFLILVAALMRKYSYFLAAVFVPLIALSRGIRAGYYQPRVIMGFIVYEPYEGFRINVALLSVAVSIISIFLFWLYTNRKAE